MKVLQMPAKWGRKAIITDGNGVVALDIENDQPHVGYIHDLVVDESKRKKGIGTKLLKKIIEVAEQNGCNKVVLWCEPIVWLHEWYERMGFIETEIGEYRMARMLLMLKM